MKTLSISLLGLVFISGAKLLAAEDVGGALAEEYLDVLEDRAKSSDARIVTFREFRRFPFRSELVELEGVARIDAERGTSIEYPEKGVAIIADEQGMVMRRFASDGSFKDRRLSAQQADTGELLASLFHFDKQSLLEQFDVKAAGEEALWAVRLFPKEGEASKLEGVEVISDDEKVHSIEIRLKGNRAFKIEPSEEEELDSFSNEIRTRYFR